MPHQTNRDVSCFLRFWSYENLHLDEAFLRSGQDKVSLDDIIRLSNRRNQEDFIREQANLSGCMEISVSSGGEEVTQNFPFPSFQALLASRGKELERIDVNTAGAFLVYKGSAGVEGDELEALSKDVREFCTSIREMLKADNPPEGSWQAMLAGEAKYPGGVVREI